MFSLKSGAGTSIRIV